MAFNWNTADVQDHIHLSTTLDGAPENSPSIKWKVRDWAPIPVVIADTRRTLTGILKKHRLTRNGSVVHLVDYNYIVKVDDYWGVDFWTRYKTLIDMHGEQVYLVDNQHIADGEDHTPYVRTMYLNVVSKPEYLSTAIKPLYFTIELQDDSLA